MKNNNQLISVIVPVYKVEKYLDRCIESIVNQTYKNLEIILVDDGSPDNCPAICDSWSKKDDRIKVIHKPNGGLSDARNAGLKIASGDFIAFVDSDDHIKPNTYESLINKQKESDSDLTFCKYIYSYEKDNTIINVDELDLKLLCENRDISHFYHRATTNKKVGDKIEIKGAVMAFVWRILFKRSAISNNNFVVGVKFMEDQLFLSQLLSQKKYKLSFVDEYLYFYSIRSGSLVHVKAKGIVENMKIFVSNMERYLLNSDFSKYIDGIKYFCYSECVIAKIISKESVDLSEIKHWSNSQNYKANKSITHGFKQKLKYFLIRYKLYFILKILYKIK